MQFIFFCWSFEISGNILRNKKKLFVLDLCILKMFSSFGPISVFYWLLCETRNYSILSLAFIASSLRVTEENLVFETVHSGPYSFLNVFSALEGTNFYILSGIFLKSTKYIIMY